jgi:hypothetical protein
MWHQHSGVTGSFLYLPEHHVYKVESLPKQNMIQYNNTISVNITSISSLRQDGVSHHPICCMNNNFIYTSELLFFHVIQLVLNLWVDIPTIVHHRIKENQLTISLGNAYLPIPASHPRQRGPTWIYVECREQLFNHLCMPVLSCACQSMKTNVMNFSLNLS